MNQEPTTLRVGQLQSRDYETLEAVRSASGLVDWGQLPTLVVTGPDRSSWLNGLLTCDVSVVSPGTGTWGLLLDRLGKIQAVVGVLADRERLYLGVLWGDAPALTQELDARLVMEDAELAPLDGPAFWRLRVGATIPAAESGAVASGVITLAGKSLLSLASEPSLPVDVPVLSSEAWRMLRIQHGLPWGGVDFDEAERPHEAGLERRAVSWSKGCYLGQEVVCMQDMRGKVKRSVRAFKAPGPRPQVDGELDSRVLQAGKPVGAVTSVVYDPHSSCYWMLARVPVSQSADVSPEAALTWVEAGAGLPLAEVHST